MFVYLKRIQKSCIFYGRVFTRVINHHRKGLLAVNTKLGWTVLGKTEGSEQDYMNSNILLSLHVNNFDISEFWSLDTIGIRDPREKASRKEIEDAAREHFLQAVTRDKDGKYEVNLPWIKDHPPMFDCRNIAEKRLDRCVKSFDRSGRVTDYEKVFENWFEEDIIENAEIINRDGKEHFLTHRPIFKDNSTTKVIPVFDGSIRQENYPSLNDCLEKGPNLIELIPSIINKFRLIKFDIIVDIEKAFLQIGVQKNDRPYLKFLWWEHGKRQNLRCFQHKRVVFWHLLKPVFIRSHN
ncbi:uncharacterized protein [Parasteatoda tepidariorum]|uniref:uncharacterized protein n=1 Tax=Parasteatoda tepidariorum TaxID=114398 RepID=UPI0039BC92FE